MDVKTSPSRHKKLRWERKSSKPHKVGVAPFRTPFYSFFSRSRSVENGLKEFLRSFFDYFIFFSTHPN